MSRSTDKDVLKAKEWFDRGREFEAQMCYHDALEAFDFATKLKPDFCEAWVRKAAMLVLLGYKSEAVVALDMADKCRSSIMDPVRAMIASDSPALLVMKANLLAQLGRDQEAKRVLEEAKLRRGASHLC